MKVKPAPPVKVDVKRCLVEVRRIFDPQVRDIITNTVQQMQSVIQAHQMCPKIPFNAKETLYLRLLIRRVKRKAKEVADSDCLEFIEGIWDEINDHFALDHFN